MIGVYSITNLINGKRYVGSSIHIEVRHNVHLRLLRLGTHHAIKLQRAWEKYGEANFTFEMLEECVKEGISQREQYWIDYFDSFNNGYNSTKVAGGRQCKARSEETRRKISEANKGKKKPYLAERNRQRTRQWSDESKKRMVEKKRANGDYDKMAEMSKEKRTGKTFEDIYGKERAEDIKERTRITRSQYR